MSSSATNTNCNNNGNGPKLTAEALASAAAAAKSIPYVPTNPEAPTVPINGPYDARIKKKLRDLESMDMRFLSSTLNRLDYLRNNNQSLIEFLKSDPIKGLVDANIEPELQEKMPAYLQFFFILLRTYMIDEENVY